MSINKWMFFIGLVVFGHMISMVLDGLLYGGADGLLMTQIGQLMGFNMVGDANGAITIATTPWGIISTFASVATWNYMWLQGGMFPARILLLILSAGIVFGFTITAINFVRGTSMSA